MESDRSTHSPNTPPESPHENAGSSLPQQLKGLNIYLIGMMGAGKTTLGQRVAAALGYRFLDTDALIEQAAKQPITQIFAESGETAFRALETQVLSQVASYKKVVIATGGGIVIERQNWNFLHYGATVWLDVPADVLYERLKTKSDRPLLNTDDPQKALQTILNQRNHLYAQADTRISVTQADTPEQITQRILDALQSVIKPEVLPPQPGEFEVRYDS